MEKTGSWRGWRAVVQPPKTSPPHPLVVINETLEYCALVRSRGESSESSLSWGGGVMALVSRPCVGFRGYGYVLEAEEMLK